MDCPYMSLIAAGDTDMATQFNVRHAAGCEGFKAYGYPTTGTSIVIESGIHEDRSVVERWAEAASRGEYTTETKWASYADD